MYTQADHRVIATELRLMQMGLEEAVAVKIAPRLTFGVVTQVTRNDNVVAIDLSVDGAKRTAFYDVKGNAVAA